MLQTNRKITPCGLLYADPIVNKGSSRAVTGCSITCEACRSFGQCADQRGIKYCFQCTIYPCNKFEAFAESKKAQGEDLKYNLKMIEVMGEDYFLNFRRNI